MNEPNAQGPNVEEADMEKLAAMLGIQPPSSMGRVGEWTSVMAQVPDERKKLDDLLDSEMEKVEEEFNVDSVTKIDDDNAEITRTFKFGDYTALMAAATIGSLMADVQGEVKELHEERDNPSNPDELFEDFGDEQAPQTWDDLLQFLRQKPQFRSNLKTIHTTIKYLFDHAQQDRGVPIALPSGNQEMWLYVLALASYALHQVFPQGYTHLPEEASQGAEGEQSPAEDSGPEDVAEIDPTADAE